MTWAVLTTVLMLSGLFAEDPYMAAYDEAAVSAPASFEDLGHDPAGALLRYSIDVARNGARP